MANILSPLVEKYQRYITQVEWVSTSDKSYHKIFLWVLYPLQLTKLEDPAEQEEMARALYNLISFARWADPLTSCHIMSGQWLFVLLPFSLAELVRCSLIINRPNRMGVYSVLQR